MGKDQVQSAAENRKGKIELEGKKEKQVWRKFKMTQQATALFSLYSRML